MKFIIQRSLVNGKYYVVPNVSDVQQSEIAWFRSFGEPELILKGTNGSYRVKIREAADYSPFPFASQADADLYAQGLKKQIEEIKKRMQENTDQWSGDEEL